MSNPDKEAAGKGVDLDYILENEVGQFGKYQLITLLLTAVPIIFCGFAATEYIFTTARIPSRCQIPQCEESYPRPQFDQSWVQNAIPVTDSGSLEECEKFADNVTATISVEPGTCPVELFDQRYTTECDGYVYQNQLTVVYDFDLACDEWRRSLIGFISTIGTLFVQPITGYISDRWGRRVALSINAFNTGWIGLVRSFVNSYEWFVALEFLEAAFGAGAFASCYILVTELVGPKYRVAAGATISTLFAVGLVFLGLIAWAVPQWRTLTRVIYAPQLIVITYFWIISESVRWLMSKGKYEEAEKLLEKVAKTNKKVLSQESLQGLREKAEAEKSIQKEKEPWLVVLVFRSKTILSRCIVTPVLWVTNTLVYFGMSINAVNLSGNQYLNFVYVAAIEIPGFWTAILLLDRIGRKPVLICAYWLCAACQFGFAFLSSEDYPELTLFLYLFGKYCIAIVMTSVYVYTTELYPTKYRHNLFAFSSMVGRLGAIIAPLTPALALEVWEPLPSVLFGSFALVSGALIFTTPETRGIKLPDTIEEAEQLSKKPRV